MLAHRLSLPTRFKFGLICVFVVLCRGSGLFSSKKDRLGNRRFVIVVFEPRAGCSLFRCLNLLTKNPKRGSFATFLTSLESRFFSFGSHSRTLSVILSHLPNSSMI